MTTTESSVRTVHAGAWRLNVLGPVELCYDGRTVEVSGITRTLLALLARNPGAEMNTATIVAGIWGGEPPEDSEKEVASHISRLRRALTVVAPDVDPTSVVVTMPSGYILAIEPSNADILAFERLAADGERALAVGQPALAAARLDAALALWRGPAYADFDEHTGATTVAAEAARLEEMRLAVIESTMDARLAIAAPSAPAELLTELPELLARHWHRERLWAQWMTVLFRLGRRTDALATFRQAEESLAQRLGSSMGPELQAIERALIVSDRALYGRPIAPTAVPTALAATVPACVGRDEELAWLSGALDLAATRRAQARLIVGSPGTGKTRIVAELARRGSLRGIAAHYWQADTIGLDGFMPEENAVTLVVIEDLDQASHDEVAKVTGFIRSTMTRPVVTLLTCRDPVRVGDLSSLPKLVLSALDDHAVADIVRVYAPAASDGMAVAAMASAGGIPARVHRSASEWAFARAGRRIDRAVAEATEPTRRLGFLADEVIGGVLDLAHVRAQARPLRPAVRDVVARPYKGLASYDVTDTEIFHGRDRLVAELVSRLVERRLLAVVGDAGTGKSSLVRAGLLPALAAGVLPASARWRQVIVKPGVGGSLAEQVAPHLDDLRRVELNFDDAYLSQPYEVTAEQPPSPPSLTQHIPAQRSDEDTGQDLTTEIPTTAEGPAEVIDAGKAANAMLAAHHDAGHGDNDEQLDYADTAEDYPAQDYTAYDGVAHDATTDDGTAYDGTVDNDGLSNDVGGSDGDFRDAGYVRATVEQDDIWLDTSPVDATRPEAVPNADAVDTSEPARDTVEPRDSRPSKLDTDTYWQPDVGGVSGTETTPVPGQDSILLIVDQFEEVFTVLGAEARQAFLTTMVELAETNWVVLTMRADFYARCGEYVEFAALLSANTVLMRPMTADEMRRAIELPAAAAGLELEDGLAEHIVDDARQLPDLAHFSTSVYALWEHRIGATLTHDAYDAGGGAAGALENLAENAFDALSSAERDAAQRIMLCLTATHHSDVLVRRRASLAEVVATAGPAAPAALEKLVAGRLIAVSEGTVEVTHEAVLEHWPRVRMWLDDALAEQGQRRHLTEAARVWAQTGEASALYRGARLAAALDLAKQHHLSPLEQNFLDAGQRLVLAADIRRRRRVVRLWRYLAASIAVAILAILVAAVAVVLQLRSSAADAKADGQRLASQAVAEPDFRKALLLAVAATQLDDGTAGTIRTVLLGSPDLVAAAGTDVTTVALSPDGRTVAAATTEGTIWLYGADTLNSMGRLDFAGHVPVNGLAFTPDGRRLVSWGGPRTGTSQAPTIVVWDLASKQPQGPAFGQPWPDAGGGLLADGSTLLLAQHGSDPAKPPTAVAWSIDARTPSTAYALPSSGIDAMQLSPDGRYVVLGTSDGTRIVDLTAGSNRLVPGATKPLALSPDGRTLLTTDGANVGVWDLVSGDRIGEAVRHSGDVLGAAWSPDASRFATVGADGLVIVWDAKSLQPVKALTGHGGAVRVVRFGADGGMLYSVGADGSLFAWDLTGARGLATKNGAKSGDATTTSIGLACALAGRDLTQQEWQTYLPHRSYRHVCPT